MWKNQHCSTMFYFRKISLTLLHITYIFFWESRFKFEIHPNETMSNVSNLFEERSKIFHYYKGEYISFVSHFFSALTSIYNTVCGLTTNNTYSFSTFLLRHKSAVIPRYKLFRISDAGNLVFPIYLLSLILFSLNH